MSKGGKTTMTGINPDMGKYRCTDSECNPEKCDSFWFCIVQQKHREKKRQ